jgi:guanylate kinase
MVVGFVFLMLKRGRVLTDRIIGLIGESGSGKTTVAKILEKKGYNVIHSYTTRKAREKDEWGHIFINQNDISFDDDFTIVRYSHAQPEHIIAYVYYNDNHYWATREQCLGHGNSIYVIDPVGFVDLLTKVDLPVIGIYLSVPFYNRAVRLEKRDGFKKAVDRLIHDSKMFESFKVDWIVQENGRSPMEIAENIIEIINNP